MRWPLIGLLALGLLSLGGCPQPADTVPADGAAGAPGGPPPDGAAGPPPDGAAANPPPADGSAPPPTDGAASATPPADGTAPPPPSDGPPPFVPPPGLAALITDGKSVTISGTVKGLKEAQIDFTAAKTVDGQVLPEVLEIVKTTDGTFSVKAPAKFDRDLYVSAIPIPTEGKPPSAEDPGGLATPFKIDGKDVKLEIIVGDKSWNKKLPWFKEGLPPGANGTALTPVDGAPAAGTPAGPPPTTAAAPASK